MIRARGRVTIDIGGSTVKTAIVDDGLNIIDRETAPTASGLLDSVIANCLVGLLDRCDRDVVGCGVGVPEYVRHGRVTSSIVVGWTDRTLDVIGQALTVAAGHPVPVVIDADVRCGAVAEHHRCPDPDRESLLYISWGTGLSSSLVLPGRRCWEGARGEALALGEWPAGADDESTLEQLCSGRGIAERYADRGGPAGRSARDVAVLAGVGDRFALDALTTAGRHLGLAIRRLIDVFDPHHVVIGGGLGATDTAARRELMRTIVHQHDRPGRPAVQVAAWGPDSGLIGAALLTAPRATRH